MYWRLIVSVDGEIVEKSAGSQCRPSYYFKKLDESHNLFTFVKAGDLTEH